jgi:tetratricopeptide (TPR) repeat protein
LFSLVVAWGLYRRLRFFYWLTVGLLFLGFMMPVYQAAKAETMPLILLATEVGTLVVALSFAFMAYDEFAWVEERITGSVDRDVSNGSSLYARGREYARCGMWARAAAHWSRAVALSPGQPDYRLALASAYVHLGQPERAREHLDEAGRIEPNHPQIRELLEALNY